MMLMITAELIEQQKELERRQIKGGLDRLKKQTKDLENKSYASASEYGRASIDQLLPLVSKRIHTKLNDRLNRATGYQLKLLNYIAKLEPDAAAAIACKRTFDKVFSHKKDDNRLIKVAESIGQAIEAECQMRHYEETSPGLLAVLKKNYWHQSKGTQQKLTAIQTVINRYDIPRWISWGNMTNIKVGGWYLDVVCEASGWFDKQFIQRKKKDTYIVPTEEFLKNKEDIIKIVELFSPLTWPMLIPPRDWSNLEAGGYYLNALTKCHEMVRRGAALSIQGNTPLTFLNIFIPSSLNLKPNIVPVVGLANVASSSETEHCSDAPSYEAVEISKGTERVYWLITSSLLPVALLFETL